MARVYDLEQLIEPTLLGCDKARISIEVNIFFKSGVPLYDAHLVRNLHAAL